MEAVPRLPMLSFELKHSPEKAQFGSPLKQYIASFYNEDPESYNTEISNLESLRNAAMHPSQDVAGCQLLKKYFCQLHFLKSRFPMAELQPAAVYFSWKDGYTNMLCSVPDIRFELMCILHNIGALHARLGSADSRTSPEGMKMACTHFQCAAWAFQTIKESYHQMISYMSSIEVVHFMQQVCLAQAQECILEKSMMDNRKATIIAKVAVQVVDFYKRALSTLQSGAEESTFTDLVGSNNYKEWVKFITFKVSYHKCIALLFQGQQAEEQQKMGERVAFYQAACEQLEEARKLSTGLKPYLKEINEALAFTSDVVEGKRKAAKNENEFIYHEEVPEKHALQEVKGAALVKGIPFNVNDVEVSGPDIFARLVPMEAHEASSLYSEKKAQLLRQIGDLVERKDQTLVEFMSSLQLDVFTQMKQAKGLPQELVDRAAALSARPSAAYELKDSMEKLSNSYRDVELMLYEIDVLLEKEEQSEREYQDLMGKRPPSIIATDLAREAAKYREAHNKANDSNKNLQKATSKHLVNLKILSEPLSEIQQKIPSIELPNANIDESTIKEIENLIGKVEEMRNQRAMLWQQFRDAVHKDDITSVLVTRQADQSLDQLFQQELEKHQELASLIEQNAVAQENILKAFVDAYARSTNTRRYMEDLINQRNTSITALITAFDTCEDLYAKAEKGIEFYNKLETNVSKLLQRIKSASKVQQEEREQILLKNSVTSSKLTPSIHKEDAGATLPPVNSTSTAPKLKDYLDSRKKIANNITPAATKANFGDNTQQQYYPSGPVVQAPQVPLETQIWPPAIRPTPVGSEVTDAVLSQPKEMANIPYANYQYDQYNNAATFKGAMQHQQPHQYYEQQQTLDQQLAERMATLQSHYSNYSSYTPDHFHGQSIYANYQTPVSTPTAAPNSGNIGQAAPTATTDTYQPILSSGYIAQYQTDQNSTVTGVNYPVSNASATPTPPVNNYQQQYPYVSSTTSSEAYPQSYQQQMTQQYYQNYQTGGTYATNPANVYYPANYGPNAMQVPAPTPSPALSDQQQHQQQSSTSSSYSANEYATSVHGNTNIPNYQQTSSTYSAPTIDMKSSQSLANNYVLSNQSGSQVHQHQLQQQQDQQQTQTSQYGVYDYYSGNYMHQQQNNVQQVYPNTYAYGHQPQANTVLPPPNNNINNASTLQSNNQVNAVEQQQQQTIMTKESNIDLLTGLDFTVNQAPLIPQQKPIAEMETKKNAVEENKESNPSATSKQATANNTTSISKLSDEIPIEKIINRKPLNNPEVKKLFTQEIDKFEKFVDVLLNKTLSGPTNLELKWKEIQDKQENEKKVISVARCYPMKNRYPDILPFDYSRVELKATKDDYINASHVRDISYYAAPLIITQAPLASTISDFWTMIWEQQVELIICLLNDSEINNEIYWPTEKSKDLTLTGMVISLVNITVTPHWTERLISINRPEKRESRTLMHLQFTAWPGSLFPTRPEEFTNFTTQCANLYLQQRSTHHPILVHCSAGIGRSGLFALLITAILDVTNANSIPDFVSIANKLASSRKNVLRDKEHLKFAYEAFLTYMRQFVRVQQPSVVARRLSDVKTEGECLVVKQDDPLSSLDPFWASKKGE